MPTILMIHFKYGGGRESKTQNVPNNARNCSMLTHDLGWQSDAIEQMVNVQKITGPVP